MRPYKRCVSDCDVSDRAKLAEYRQKRDMWSSLMEHDPKQSVTRQVTALLWHDAVFRLFNEMRVNAPGERTPAITSPLLTEALDSGYVTVMLLGISRLVDRRTDVVSLRRVLNDVRASRPLLTREHFVCFDGMRFDPATIPPIWERARPGERIWTELGGPLDASTPRRLHEVFDKLSGVSIEHRQRSDLIAESTFDEIEALLDCDAISAIIDKRHKFVAHAADETSRAKKPLAGYSTSMAEVENALRVILRAIEKLNGDILQGTAWGFMATAQFNVLDGFGGSLTEEHLEELQEIWERLTGERNEWHR